MKTHAYEIHSEWAGSTGAGYRNYDRGHHVSIASNSLHVSADPAFLGDAQLPNPEQLLLAAASSCQLLSFLAVAALAAVDVIAYEDDAHAVMPEAGTATQITEIDLHVRVTVRGADETHVLLLLEKAHAECYISNTLKAKVTVHPTVTVIA